MKALLRDLLPNAPDLGLYVAPDIPSDKLAAALGDYAPGVEPDRVIALYDATRLGSAKDGAVFLDDRFVFQNNDLHTPRAVRYDDIVGVRSKRRLLGGKTVEVDLNRARATVTETLDFSGQPGAAEYVERFLHEAMLHGVPSAGARTAGPPGGTDRRAVEAALDELVARGRLADADRQRMLEVLG